MRRLATLIPIALALSVACLPPAFDDPFPTADDVTLASPPAFAVEAELVVQARLAVARADRAVAANVDAVQPVVAALEGRRETRRDGATRVYGPYPDPGSDAAVWVARFEGEDPVVWSLATGDDDATEDETTVVMSGELGKLADLRTGTIALDFDALATVGTARFEDAALRSGRADVSFENAEVVIDFIGFDDGASPTFADERFASSVDDDASRLHVALTGTFAGTVIEQASPTRVEMDLAWRTDGSGRARATLGGGTVVHECWTQDGGLVWRDTEPPGAIPGAATGDPAACTVALAELDF